MSKFEYNSAGFSEALKWAKTYVIEDGKTLYDAIKGLPTSEEKLSFINQYRD